MCWCCPSVLSSPSHCHLASNCKIADLRLTCVQAGPFASCSSASRSCPSSVADDRLDYHFVIRCEYVISLVLCLAAAKLIVAVPLQVAVEGCCHGELDDVRCNSKHLTACIELTACCLADLCHHQGSSRVGWKASRPVVDLW